MAARQLETKTKQKETLLSNSIYSLAFCTNDDDHEKW